MKEALEELLPIGNACRTTVACPDGLKPFKAASPTEKLRRANRVLREARKLYRARYGCVVSCINASNVAAPIDCEYAKQLLRSLVGECNISGVNGHGGWENSPTTKRADVYRLLDAAIRRSDLRHGGWIVGVK